MDSLHERSSEQFYKWENRCRGWQVFPEPVFPEPPFAEFNGHYLPEVPVEDDGRRPTILSSVIRKLSRSIGDIPEPPPIIPEPEEEPEPQSLVRSSISELTVSLPADLDFSRDVFEQFVSNLARCREPLAFEILGIAGAVSVQFASGVDDAPLLKRQLQAYFPEALFQSRTGTLEAAWEKCKGGETLAVDFGLAREFVYPLASSKLDPFVGIIGALSELRVGELGLFQVIFQHAHQPWAESIVNLVAHADGKPFFANQPELLPNAQKKIERPLFAAVVRVAIKTDVFERTLQIAKDVASALCAYSNPRGNELIPLRNDEYLFEDHVEDVLQRQSRRTGMLLSSEELIAFVHLPSKSVRSSVFQRNPGKTKAAPDIVRQDTGVLLGTNVHAGESVPVRLSPEQRVRHVHIIGASGTGKSTLLFNLIQDDIENGEGLAVLDPHGDLVDKILGIIPAHRINDVVLVDPADEEYSIGFNILSAHSDLEKNLLSSDLVSVFQRLSTSWGDQMGSVLNNAILSFLESKRKGTLADLRRFLIEPAFRAEFLKSVDDPALLYYWQKGFPQLSGNKSIGPIVTRLETFLAPKPIRYMVSQPENRLDFAEIMDTGKIFLAKLSQGLLGRENSYLLGSLLVSKFQQLAMARQAKQVSLRRNFWVYLDEFHHFITPSMAEILAGARKYRIGLILAHQELRQLQRDSEVASAVLSNPYTRICFRVGDDDARKLSDGFAFFESRDLQNLGTGEAVARVERSDFDFNLSVPFPTEPDGVATEARKHEAITASREKYATPRAEVESALRKLWEAETTPPLEKPTPKPPAPIQKLQIAEPPSTEVIAHPLPPALAPVVLPIPEPKAATVSETKAPVLPADLGRGGAQHQAIQKRIKEAAEKLGFRSTIEKPTPDGLGSIDLLLERTDRSFACEISVTTPIHHEVDNVAKCLKAGSATVVIITTEERLKRITAAVAESRGADAAARVIYCQPDQFIARLQALPPPIPKAPELETVLGWKVKRSTPKLTPEEQKERQESAIRNMAEIMRRKS